MTAKEKYLLLTAYSRLELDVDVLKKRIGQTDNIDLQIYIASLIEADMFAQKKIAEMWGREKDDSCLCNNRTA